MWRLDSTSAFIIEEDSVAEDFVLFGPRFAASTIVAALDVAMAPEDREGDPAAVQLLRCVWAASRAESGAPRKRPRRSAPCRAATDAVVAGSKPRIAVGVADAWCCTTSRATATESPDSES